MIPELGSILLSLSLSLSIFSIIYPLAGVLKNDPYLMRSAGILTLGSFISLFGSLICLAYAIIINDFTVKYVIQHSGTQLPLYYKIASVWGGQEGSLLMWVFFMNGWAVLTALFNNIFPVIKVKVLIVLSLINSGVIAFILFISNPFERSLPFIPLEGYSLNPMLQNVIQIIHPPLIYLGYTGFSVIFSFSVVSLITGRIDILLSDWLHRKVIISWVFLTGGILSGALWAYHILGWGGWWFWDPVENASLMPWLAAIALIHSLYLARKNNIFILWPVLLSIIVFALCLTGLFLVRSGILVSVHSFSPDPNQGLIFLLYLAIVISPSLILFAFKGQLFILNHSEKYKSKSFFSKKRLLLSGIIILLSALTSVMLGTFLPFIYKLSGVGAVSIDISFFNRIFGFLFIPLSLSIAITPLIKWSDYGIQYIRGYLIANVIISVISSYVIVIFYSDDYYFSVWLYLSLSVFIIIITIEDVYLYLLRKGVGCKNKYRYAGMVLAHMGIPVMVIGIVFSQYYAVTKDISIETGKYSSISEYQIYFDKVDVVYNKGYVSEVVTAELYKDNKLIAKLYPDKSFYPERNITITNPAVYHSISDDLHIIPGKNISGHLWTFRLYKKPFMSFIWFGGFLITFGGILCLFYKNAYIDNETEYEK